MCCCCNRLKYLNYNLLFLTLSLFIYIKKHFLLYLKIATCGILSILPTLLDYILVIVLPQYTFIFKVFFLYKIGQIQEWNTINITMNLLPIEHRDTNFNQSNTMYAPELSIGCRTHDNFTCLHEPRGARFLPTQIHIYSTAKCASAQQTHSRVAQLDPICYYITIKPAIIAFIPFG